MREYKKPELEISKFDINEIITASVVPVPENLRSSHTSIGSVDASDVFDI